MVRHSCIGLGASGDVECLLTGGAHLQLLQASTLQIDSGLL